MRSKVLGVLLCLCFLAPMAAAKWVRFEAEDAILSSPNTSIDSYADASGGEGVLLINADPAGTIDYVVNVREPNTFPMRIGFYANGTADQKYDLIYVNDMTTAFIDQNWNCGYYWDPFPRPSSKFESFRNSIITYGTQVQFQLLSRWWAAWDDAKRDIPMAVNLAAGKNIIRIKSGWSYTTHDFIELDLPDVAYDSVPADGDTEVRGTQTTLSWKNPAGVTQNKIYFGQSDSEPNYLDYQAKLTQVITLNNPGLTPSIAMPASLVDGKNYYWVVDGYDTPSVDPNFPGVIWSFQTQFNAAPVVTIDQPYPYLGQGGIPGQVIVSLDAAVVDDGPIVSYAWTQLAGPATAVINSPASEDTTITITEEGHPYQFQLTVSDGLRSSVGVVEFHVDDTVCEAALRKPNTHNIADINYDCLVNLGDFQAMASAWLNCIDTVTNCN